MAKYDAVDRLMSLATDKATPKAASVGATEQPVQTPATREAEAVLEAKMVAVEPETPLLAGFKSGRSTTSVSSGRPSTPVADPSLPATSALRGSAAAKPVGPAAGAVARPNSGLTAIEHARPGAGERGRQLLSALRPFLPVVGGALRMVDHGAVQAVARLLPLLGGSGAGASAPSPAASETQHPLSGALAALDQRHAGVLEELKRLKARNEAQEEQLRRIRDSQERTIAEQGSQGHLLHLLADRSRLLTAGVIILFMLVVAEAVLLLITMHR